MCSSLSGQGAAKREQTCQYAALLQSVCGDDALQLEGSDSGRFTLRLPHIVIERIAAPGFSRWLSSERSLNRLVKYAIHLLHLRMLLQVSWVRHRDIHLLTVGRYTYTSDQRFRAIHHPHTEDWSLQIKYPQHRDSGIYECQISTTPHMSHFVHLNVIGKHRSPTAQPSSWVKLALPSTRSPEIARVADDACQKFQHKFQLVTSSAKSSARVVQVHLLRKLNHGNRRTEPPLDAPGALGRLAEQFLN
uniref:Ig-like domain-containing protein n=1 Tax=Anopheles coluzzii TaxID=1518534 RepID=A0A8W7Q3A0_ANOCL